MWNYGSFNFWFSFQQFLVFNFSFPTYLFLSESWCDGKNNHRWEKKITRCLRCRQTWTTRNPVSEINVVKSYIITSHYTLSVLSRKVVIFFRFPGHFEHAAISRTPHRLLNPSPTTFRRTTFWQRAADVADGLNPNQMSTIVITNFSLKL